MKASIVPTRVGITTFAIAVSLALPVIANAQVQILLNETVGYAPLSSSGSNYDRPSVAVRNDGLVRVTISDFQGPCCPLQVPLKVATRGPSGGWTHLIVGNYGDHAVPHFLANGNLGITYNDFGSGSTITFAEVTSSGAVLDPAHALGKNPSGFVRLAPWVLEPTGNVQAVVRYDLRLRRTASGWAQAAVTGTPQDVALGAGGTVHVMTSQGLWTFPGYDLGLKGTHVKAMATSSASMIVDPAGNLHFASFQSGAVSYSVMIGSTLTNESVAMGVGELLNDQALLLDASLTPFIIYRNAAGKMVVAGKGSGGWTEQADLGPGTHGTMVSGPQGLIHASFTNTNDRLVHYAILQSCAGSVVPYGSGLAGSGGLTPALNGSGCPELGQSIIFDITNGLGGTTGALFIGTKQLSIPGLGGTLLVDPLVQLFHPLGGAPLVAGAGTVTFAPLIPVNPILSGLTVYLQAMYLDPGAPVLVSMTNGLALTIG